MPKSKASRTGGKRSERESSVDSDNDSVKSNSGSLSAKSRLDRTKKREDKKQRLQTTKLQVPSKEHQEAEAAIELERQQKELEAHRLAASELERYRLEEVTRLEEEQAALELAEENRERARQESLDKEKLLNIDSRMTDVSQGVPTGDPAPNANTGGTDDMDQDPFGDLEEFYDNLINGVEAEFEALVYDGFNPEKCRAKLYNDNAKTLPRSKKVVEIVIRGLIAYLHVGSNINKIDGKVMNKITASALKKYLSDNNIKIKASSSDDLTLPRLAICFMGPYLLIRHVKKAKLQSQTKSTIDVTYRDLVFAGDSSIFQMAGYKEYYDEFSKTISPPKKKKKPNEDELEEKVKTDWVSIAQIGYSTDVFQHRYMKHAKSMMANPMTSMKDVTMLIGAMVDMMKLGEADMVYDPTELVSPNFLLIE